MPTRAHLRAAALLSAIGLLACGPREYRIHMTEDNASGQNGETVVLDYGDKFTVDVTISANASDPGNQLIHIHPNRCGNIGPPVLAMESLVNGHSFTTFTDAEGVDADFQQFRKSDFAFNAHTASDPSVYASCGNIPRER